MKKINETGLDDVAISISALKTAAKNDELVILTADMNVEWFEVQDSQHFLGRNGKAILILKNITNNDLQTLEVKSVLPYGIIKVRKIGKGINKKTLLKAESIATKQIKERENIIQPVGEFENILDVPEDPPEDNVIAV